MSVSDNSTLYAAVINLSQILSRDGETGWSSMLDNALSLSTVPGEILGETRYALELLQASEIAARLDLRDQIDDALSYVDRVLGAAT